MDTITIVLAALAGSFLLAAIVLAALWRHARRAQRRAVAARRALERDRAERELALSEQTNRLRVVRELHELVVTSLSVLISHADGARYAAKQDPGVVARSADVIADVARSTLADLRRVMALAREGEVAVGALPGLEVLDDLYARMREAGLTVTVRESGERPPLKQGAELAVYRILEQALENTLAHGGPGTEASVSLDWTEDGLELSVADDGARAAARRAGFDPDAAAAARTLDDDLLALVQPPIGRGMTEMRERAELYGGMLTAAPITGVGFRVTAVFPSLRDHRGIEGVKLGEE